jgi:hypothetical protein
LAKSTPILINFFTDGLPLCGAPATTPWHYDAVEERPSTSSCEDELFGLCLARP